MTVRRRVIPPADGGVAWVLAATTIVLIASWPVRAETANASWYAVTVTRLGALVVWAWVLGAASQAGPEARRRDLTRLVIAAVVSAPLEAAAHVATLPGTPVAWSLIVAVPAAFTALGLSAAVAWLVRRARLPALLPAVSLLVAVGLVALDLRVLGSAAFVPWVLPSSPGPLPGAVLGTLAAITLVRVAGLGRPGRETTPAGADGS